LISTGALPQTRLGEITALLQTQAVFKWPTSKESNWGRGREKEGEAKEGREERPYAPAVTNSWLRQCSIMSCNNDSYLTLYQIQVFAVILCLSYSYFL